MQSNYYNGELTIKLSGRLDTTIAQQTNEEICQIVSSCKDISKLTFDASELEYISSTGLRIVLNYKKQFTNFEVINVSNDIFNVFEMTGFSRIMTIKKALRKMSVEGCEEIGRGGVGVVYRISDDTIVKVFREGSEKSELDNELRMSKEAFVLGMPTAIAYDTVQVGNCYGLVYELLGSNTLGKNIALYPEKIPTYAEAFGKLLRQIHSIKVDSPIIPPVADRLRGQIEKVRKYFNEEQIDILHAILDKMPESSRMLHCDCHPKNMMLQGEELILIDMGEVSCGHPLIDLGNTYSAMHINEKFFESIVGFDIKYRDAFWQQTLATYFQTTDAEELKWRDEQLQVASLLRNFLWLSLSDSFPESMIANAQQEAAERLIPHKQHIFETLDSFNEFPLF